MSTGARSHDRKGQRAATPLTPCEFEIMEVMWRMETATVREVHAALQPVRGLAYTTVMTVMDKLHRKGALQQQRRGRAYCYSVQLGRQEALHHRIRHLVDDYFEGSTDKLLEYLRQEFGATLPEPLASEPARRGHAIPAEEMDASLL
jgi:predicted transcriptional regulator